MKKLNQNGFGIIEVALIVIALAAVTGVGFYVYNVNKDNKTTSSVSQPTPAATTETKQPAKAVVKDTAKYLEVPELGVKFKLGANTQDAYYTVNQSSFIGVSLRVHALDFEEDCRTNQLSIAGLFKVQKDAIDEISGNKYSENGAGKVVGDNYYYMRGAQYGCAQTQKGLDILANVRKDFTSAGATIEKL